MLRWDLHSHSIKEQNNSLQLASTVRIPDCHLGIVTVLPTVNCYRARIMH